MGLSHSMPQWSTRRRSERRVKTRFMEKCGSGCGCENGHEEQWEKREERVGIMAVNEVKKTRMSALEFHVADVRKPLASAVKIVRAANKVVLDSEGSYIEDKETGERMKVRIQDETFVFDVEYDDGLEGTITLDSGAGASVWPARERLHVPLLPRKPGLRMCAANGSEINNYGRKVMKFKGERVDKVERGVYGIEKEKVVADEVAEKRVMSGWMEDSTGKWYKKGMVCEMGCETGVNCGMNGEKGFMRRV